MELKNTDDLRLFIRNTIHEQWTNVTAIARKAKVSQPSLNNFVSAKREKAISTFTMFPVLEALGKKMVVIDSAPTHKHVLPCYLNCSAQPEQITKESLAEELKSRIEEYQSIPDPKPKFSVDLIIEFLEESYDKLATK